MKISQPIDKPVALSSNAATLAAKSGQVAGAPAKATAAKSTQSAGVAVTVSSLARSFEAGSGGETADIDQTKVDAVRTAIAQGSYKVNPEAIADKLLANAQEMLKRSRG